MHNLQKLPTVNQIPLPWAPASIVAFHVTLLHKCCYVCVWGHMLSASERIVLLRPMCFFNVNSVMMIQNKATLWSNQLKQRSVWVCVCDAYCLIRKTWYVLWWIMHYNSSNRSVTCYLQQSNSNTTLTTSHAVFTALTVQFHVQEPMWWKVH